MTETDDTGGSNNALPSWAVLSLQDGFAADAVYHDRFELNRLNSTFWERCRAALARDGLSVSPMLDIFHDARQCLLMPIDADQIRRDRFLRALKLGMIDAIGYRLPRDPSARPVLIPSHVWEHGQLDWNKAELSGAGFAFTHLRILIAARIFEAHDLPYQVSALSELDLFGPSEDKRARLDIPAPSTPASDTESTIGRPSLKEAILAAFDAIEKNPDWSNKELAGAIRDRVKQERGLSSDVGLGDDAILKHVRVLWHDFKQRSPSA